MNFATPSGFVCCSGLDAALDFFKVFHDFSSCQVPSGV
jgi:hypothetical protein